MVHSNEYFYVNEFGLLAVQRGVAAAAGRPERVGGAPDVRAALALIAERPVLREQGRHAACGLALVSVLARRRPPARRRRPLRALGLGRVEHRPRRPAFARRTPCPPLPHTRVLILFSLHSCLLMCLSGGVIAALLMFCLVPYSSFIYSYDVSLMLSRLIIKYFLSN